MSWKVTPPPTLLRGTRIYGHSSVNPMTPFYYLWAGWMHWKNTCSDVFSTFISFIITYTSLCCEFAHCNLSFLFTSPSCASPRKGLFSRRYICARGCLLTAASLWPWTREEPVTSVSPPSDMPLSFTPSRLSCLRPRLSCSPQWQAADEEPRGGI